MSASSIRPTHNFTNCKMCLRASPKEKCPDKLKIDRLHEKILFGFQSNKTDDFLGQIKAKTAKMESGDAILETKKFLANLRRQKVCGLLEVLKTSSVYFQDAGADLSFCKSGFYLSPGNQEGQYLLNFKDSPHTPIVLSEKHLFHLSCNKDASSLIASLYNLCENLETFKSHSQYLGVATKQQVESAINELSYLTSGAPSFIYYNLESKGFYYAYTVVQSFRGRGVKCEILHQPLCLNGDLSLQLRSENLAPKGKDVLSSDVLVSDEGHWFHENKHLYNFQKDISTRQQAKDCLSQNPSITYVTYQVNFNNALQSLGIETEPGKTWSCYAVCKVNSKRDEVNYTFRPITTSEQFLLLIKSSGRILVDVQPDTSYWF